MSTRLNVILSDDLNREIDKAVEETESSKSDILRKALTLYLASYEGKRRGMKLGLVNPETQKIETEFVGL